MPEATEPSPPPDTDPPRFVPPPDTDPPRFVPPPDPRPDDGPWPVMTWPVPPDTALAGRFVRLRPAVAADAPALFAALDDDRVWAHLGGRPAGPDELAAALAARSRVPTWQQWLVSAVAPVGGAGVNEVLGTTSFLDVSPHDARLEIGSTAYRPSVWATAVNPETKVLLLGYAFGTLRVGRVQLKTDIRNVRSQQAIARLGARYEGTLRRYQRRGDASVRDTVLFSVAAEDWPDIRSRLTERVSRF